MKRHLLAAVLALCTAGVATPVLAQGLVGGTASPETEVQDPAAEARFRFGPLRFTPTLRITNLGVDTNVYNEFEDPKQDTTAVFGPATRFWLRLGRARLSGEAGLDYHWFKKYDDQRLFGTNEKLRLEVPLNRLTPWVEGTYVNTRVRPGFEIDARARRRGLDGRAGFDLRIQGRTKLTAFGGKERFRFEATEAFLGNSLSEALDRDVDYGGLVLRYELTPLTTFVVQGDVQQDRFVRSPVRDADSVRTIAGFELRPFALISGRGMVGVRKFETLSADVPDYTGVVATADLAYTLRATRVNFLIERDVTYSFEVLEPYYLLTDATVRVTQRITSAWDVTGLLGRQTLDYRAVAVSRPDARADRGYRYGGGVGYRLGESVRLGFDVERVRRESDIYDYRNYEGVRAGASITYGQQGR